MEGDRKKERKRMKERIRKKERKRERETKVLSGGGTEKTSPRESE